MIRWLLALAILLLGADVSAARRVAVIVGSNAASPGRSSLRYAHQDAESIAQVLVDVADFTAGDIDLLLDEGPEAILSRLDQRLAQLRESTGETLLLFYYSGHADHEALYPGGRALRLAELKKRLADPSANVRVGIVDACSGGGWTGSKGLRPAEAFAVDLPLTLGSEGSALLAASSGVGDAHESEQIGGSFFTHHLVAGLRGAADRSGDGEVTLHEVFDYAQPLTIRDSAMIAGVPQRPSFEINLRGRRDLALARLASSPNQISLAQEAGPLQVIRIDSGLLVLELPSGPREIVAALPPGRYVVRRRVANATWAKEIELQEGQRLEVREQDLVPMGAGFSRAKDARPAPASTLSRGSIALQLAMGRVISSPTYLGTAEADLGGLVDLRIGLSDRVELSPLMMGATVRLGNPTGVEWLLSTLSPWAVFGSTGSGSQMFARPEVKGQLHWHLDSQFSLLLGVYGRSVVGPEQFLEEWTGGGGGAVILRIGEKVRLAAGVDLGTTWAIEGSRWVRAPRPALELGSSTRLGAAQLPLASVDVLENVSLDGYATVRFGSDTTVHESFLGGFTWTF